MIKINQASLSIFLKRNKKPKARIITKNNLHYDANNIQIIGNKILFSDRFGTEILLDISEIRQISGVQNDKKI